MRPNTIVYTTVIRAWADVGRADKAEGLLREMCQEYVGIGNGVDSNTTTNDGNGNPDAKPSLWTFNTVLAAWSRSRDPSSVIRAEGLVRTMESLSSTPSPGSSGGKKNHGGKAEEGTTTESATSSPDAARKNNDCNQEKASNHSALKLDVAPTIVSYNSLMGTIASRSRQPDALARAEYWMEQILAKAATAVGRKQSPDPHSHRRHQQQHQQQQQRGGASRRTKGGRKNDESMAPNLITYKALFNIIAAASNMSNADKADRMRYWLARGSSLSILSPTNSNHRGNGGSGGSGPMENSFLLGQIEALETRKKPRLEPEEGANSKA